MPKIFAIGVILCVDYPSIIEGTSLKVFMPEKDPNVEMTKPYVNNLLKQLTAGRVAAKKPENEEVENA
jgi:hypothetical protein